MSTTNPRAMSAHNTIHAVLFQATSAEYVALCLQAYQLARHALRDRLSLGTFRNPAVIFDLDETVLDNHAYAAWQIKNGANYHDDSWNLWCNACQAEAVPGALEFIRFVENAGVTPFFITSRLNATRLATLENLAALGVLSADNLKNEKAWAGDADKTVLPKNTRLFMKGMDTVNTPTPSEKKGKDWPMKDKFDHRMWVSGWRGFEIILSVGDNLGDYAEYYGRVYDKTRHTFYEKNPAVCGEKVKDTASGVEVCDNKPKLDGMHPSLAERRAAVLQDAALFGRDFVLIPNPTYGGWLRAFEANQLGSSDELAYTPAPVREPLDEPQTPFTYANPKAGQPGELPEVTKRPAGPKFDAKNQLRIWDGK